LNFESAIEGIVSVTYINIGIMLLQLGSKLRKMGFKLAFLKDFMKHQDLQELVDVIFVKVLWLKAKVMVTAFDNIVGIIKCKVRHFHFKIEFVPHFNNFLVKMNDIRIWRVKGE